MVKVKEIPRFKQDGSIDVEKWLAHVAKNKYFQNIALIRSACYLAQLAGSEIVTETPISCLQQGMAMADVLIDLKVDEHTIAASIIFECVHFAELSLDDVSHQLGDDVAKLVGGVEKMSAITQFETINRYTQTKPQVDNMRKMLLAMVDDVRIVLIKLAERLCVLRTMVAMPDEFRRQTAKETQDIYAPLANRLGIGAIKWEMEDYAFRYLEPDEYKKIAKSLKDKRIERDRYVNFIVGELNQKINELNIEHFEVYGRSKHINSIFKKMQRKNISLDEIFDATAVRVLVDTEQQCYEVLSLVHAQWRQIPAEFDDYIINKKANGYQSLHTAVVGPNDRVFEVQIRTFAMHEKAEMGVAAHWKYKEGAAKGESHERKIEWLREVLSWQQEMASSVGISKHLEHEFLEDRIYVFTPGGDIIDLPQEATILDFAYHIHTGVGHRCRGGKINKKIAQLSSTLKTGDRVEILTGKEEHPSLDWISPHHNFIKSSRAKAKVAHWFKMQNHDENLAAGHELLDKELKKLGIKAERIIDAAHAMNFKNTDDMFAAIGRGDVKASRILHKIAPETIKPIAKPLIRPHTKPEVSKSDLQVEGVGNLLTNMARCCQPIPGDDVVGYITIGRGVSIHRRDCENIVNANEKQKSRLLEVHWSSRATEKYLADIIVKAYDRTGLLRDLTALIAQEDAFVTSIQTSIDKEVNIGMINLTIEVDNIDSLSRLLSKLLSVPNVIEARRLAS